MGTGCIQVKRGSFNPITFFDDDRWSIDANRSDIRSVVLSEFSPAEIQLLAATHGDKVSVDGNERLRYIQSCENYLRLDVEIFHTLWINQHIIPDFWKQKISDETGIICFDGSVFKDKRNNHIYVICMFWEDAKWKWVLDPLWCTPIINAVSAVLPDPHCRHYL